MTDIGEVLKRKRGDGPKAVRVVAINGAAWVVESLDGFAPPIELSGPELADYYGGSADVPAFSELDAQNGMRRDWLAQRQRAEIAKNAPAPPSPEERFAQKR